MSDLIELGKRAVAAEGWEWLDAMRDTLGLRFVQKKVGWGVDGMTHWLIDGSDVVDDFAENEHYPDLSDPATLGVLLGLVRRKHGADCHTLPTWALVLPHIEYWEVGTYLDDFFFDRGRTEAEALVFALEAPKQ